MYAGKLDGVAPLMTDPPPTNSTTLQSLPYYGFERTLQDNKKTLHSKMAYFALKFIYFI
jgi:hypothetical protein